MRLSQRFTDYLNNQNDKSKLGGNEQQYTNNHVLLLPSKQVKYILKFQPVQYTLASFKCQVLIQVSHRYIQPYCLREEAFADNARTFQKVKPERNRVGNDKFDATVGRADASVQYICRKSHNIYNLVVMKMGKVLLIPVNIYKCIVTHTFVQVKITCARLLTVCPGLLK